MSLALPDMVCFALYSAAHAMQAAYKPLLAPLGLTYPQYLVLTALWAQDGQTVGALGRAMRLESNTLTPLVKRMEGQGLVTRQRDADDERQVRVHLTDTGRALQASTAHIPGCIVQRSGMTAQDLSALRDAAARLRDHIDST